MIHQEGEKLYKTQKDLEADQVKAREQLAVIENATAGINKNLVTIILNQTRDRTPMPRPAVFRDKKKYDRNAVKEEGRQEQEEHYDA